MDTIKRGETLAWVASRYDDLDTLMLGGRTFGEVRELGCGFMTSWFSRDGYRSICGPLRTLQDAKSLLENNALRFGKQAFAAWDRRRARENRKLFRKLAKLDLREFDPCKSAGN